MRTAAFGYFNPDVLGGSMQYYWREMFNRHTHASEWFGQKRVCKGRPPGLNRVACDAAYLEHGKENGNQKTRGSTAIPIHLFFETCLKYKVTYVFHG